MEQQAGNFSSSLESVRPPGINLFSWVVPLHLLCCLEDRKASRST